MNTLFTPRLELVPITLAMVEAVMEGDRELCEKLAGARLPDKWPGRELIERAFTVSLPNIRQNPYKRLWGDRLMITRDGERLVVGSVVYKGHPEDGMADIGYGVDQAYQGRGFATEATRVSVQWIMSQPGIKGVRATTFSWNLPSLRVIAKLGMRPVGTRDHELMGELLDFELRADRDVATPMPAPVSW